MIKDRREKDDTRDIAIATQAMLTAHTENDDEQFTIIKHTIGLIDVKIDRLNRNQIFAAGFLGALMFLMNYPQLIKTLQPEAAQAQTLGKSTHGRP